MDTLTPHQSDTFNQLINSDQNKVFFCGSPGTGKSHTISRFISSLGPKQGVAILGTTHKSLAVLSDLVADDKQCFSVIETVHKFLGYKMELNKRTGKEDLQKDRSGKPNKYDKFQFDYIIIDEASMLPKIIFDELDSVFSSRQPRLKKIIIVGDPIQLQIDKFLRLGSLPQFELTENMRQGEQNDLVPYLNKLRVQIETKGDVIPFPEDLTNGLLYYDHAEFLQAYKNSTVTDKRIIAYKNSTVSTYNANIKKHIMKSNKYSIGDELILSEPVVRDKKTKFTNRASVTIMTEPIQQTINAVDCYSFTIANKNGVEADINIPVTKTSLKNATQKYVDSKDWKTFYAIKEKFTTALHSYAVTTHSAQGSSYAEVWIDATDFESIPNDPLGQTLLRLIYVATSRTQENAHIFLGRTREYSALGK